MKLQQKAKNKLRVKYLRHNLLKTFQWYILIHSSFSLLISQNHLEYKYILMFSSNSWRGKKGVGS